MQEDKTYRTFKIFGGAIGVVVLIGAGIYFMACFYPSLFFYNPAYGKNTELRGYVLTDEQIVQAGNVFLKNEEFLPIELSFDQLNKHKKSFIVILAKNTGGKQAFDPDCYQTSFEACLSALDTTVATKDKGLPLPRSYRQ
jgi:hypothetical protein